VKGGMLCQEEMEKDHRVQAREQADAEALVLMVQGRPGLVSSAVRVRDLLLVEEAAGRDLVLNRRQRTARRF